MLGMTLNVLKVGSLVPREISSSSRVFELGFSLHLEYYRSNTEQYRIWVQGLSKPKSSL